MSSWIDSRVCEVLALREGDDEDGSRGSGYVVAPKRVLTARHVVCPQSSPLPHGWCVPSGLIAGRGQLCDTQIRGPTLPLWMSHFLLPLSEDFDAVRFGLIEGGDPVPVRAVGFPNSTSTRQDPNGRRIRNHPEDIRGDLRPPTAGLGDYPTVHVWGSTPRWHDAGPQPWGGASGSPSSAAPCLVGVLSRVPKSFDGDRLKVSLFRPDQDFMALLGWSIKLEVADRPMALMELFEQPDDEMKKLPPSVYLIDPAYGLVDFSGRDGELDKLRAWRLEAKASPMRLLTGEGGQGKSRVAMQLARVMSDRGWTTGLLRPDATIDEILTLLTGERPKLVVVDDANLHINIPRTLASRAPTRR